MHQSARSKRDDSLVSDMKGLDCGKEQNSGIMRVDFKMQGHELIGYGRIRHTALPGHLREAYISIVALQGTLP